MIGRTLLPAIAVLSAFAAASKRRVTIKVTNVTNGLSETEESRSSR